MNRTLVWQPPSGAALTLTDPSNPGLGRRLQADGTIGLAMAPYAFSERRAPGVAGAVATSVRAEARTIDLALLIQARNDDELDERMRELVWAMRPTEGAGTLLSVRPNGLTRRVTCRYVDGLEGDESSSVAVPGLWYRVVLGLRTDGSPYARGPEITTSWSLERTGRGWFPMIPIRLARAGIGGRRTVLNPGDVEAFPVITVNGPGLDLVARNATSGKAAHLQYTIPDGGPGSVVTIDTRRGAQSITDGYGTNLFEYLTDDDPSLWSLLPGENDVEIELQSVSEGSSVSVTFEPLYESL